MSPWLIITTSVAFTALLVVAIAVTVRKLNRRFVKEEIAALGQLHAEMPSRGWTYSARDDSIAQLYTQLQRQFWQRNPFQPFMRAPWATKASKIVTGVHRGRPFVAAVLEAFHDGTPRTVNWIAVRAPAVRPPVTVTRSVPIASAVANAISGDLRIGSPEFDEKFDVRSPDPRFAAAMLGPALTDYLTRVELNGAAWGFTLLGDTLELYGPSSGFGDHRIPAHLVAALDLRCDILDRIPAAVWA